MSFEPAFQYGVFHRREAAISAKSRRNSHVQAPHPQERERRGQIAATGRVTEDDVKIIAIESKSSLDSASISFQKQLEAAGKDAVDDASSMFNSIKQAANFLDSKVGLIKKKAGLIFAAIAEDESVVGLMRIKDEGEQLHLENVVGAPKKGGGHALVTYAKHLAAERNMPLKLEAAESSLLQYYHSKHEFVRQGNTSVMIWKNQTEGKQDK